MMVATNGHMKQVRQNSSLLNGLSSGAFNIRQTES